MIQKSLSRTCKQVSPSLRDLRVVPKNHKIHPNLDITLPGRKIPKNPLIHRKPARIKDSIKPLRKARKSSLQKVRALPVVRTDRSVEGRSMKSCPPPSNRGTATREKGHPGGHWRSLRSPGWWREERRRTRTWFSSCHRPRPRSTPNIRSPSTL